MSSFQISKLEYIKAAGLMCGAEESKKHPHKFFINSVYMRFRACYMLNIASVDEQYGVGHDCTDIDENAYLDVYDSCREIGREMMENGKREELRDKLNQFFDSSLYQIENEQYHAICAELYYECLSKLRGEYDASLDCWGEINL